MSVFSKSDTLFLDSNSPFVKTNYENTKYFCEKIEHRGQYDTADNLTPRTIRHLGQFDTRTILHCRQFDTSDNLTGVKNGLFDIAEI